MVLLVRDVSGRRVKEFASQRDWPGIEDREHLEAVCVVM